MAEGSGDKVDRPYRFGVGSQFGKEAGGSAGVIDG